MQINDPAALAEISAAFAAYERALMNDDLAALEAIFWPSPLAVRYGVGEELYGFAQISAFRLARGGSPRRRLENTVITTFGDRHATTCTEFVREPSRQRGRQTQTWVRMENGWQIVAAHVSLPASHS